MRVAVYDRHGGPERVRIASEAPSTPSADELLVRVHAAALNPKDILVQAGKSPLFRLLSGRRFPKRIGYDWSGEVLEVGAAVRGFAKGDAVFGMIDSWKAGACATHAVVSIGELARKPPSLSWEEAAAIPLAALTALQALRDVAEILPRQRVLINGASGGVGTFAVQIAKLLGAHVIAVTSGRNAELVASIGADEVIDYTARDPLEVVASSEPVDVLFDVFGNKSFANAQRGLAPHGIYVSTVPKLHVARAMVCTILSSKRARIVVVKSRARDLETLADWAERGALKVVLDGVHSLEELGAAERRLSSKRAVGKVVIRMPAGA